ncbi:MAG: T9SS type A sorting domain-containing protein [Bacteroidia bacterium]
MKKIILLSLMGLPLLVFGQHKEPKIPFGDIVTIPNSAVQMDVIHGPTQVGLNHSANLKYKAQPYSFVELGTTWYDLQTNHSVGTRIVLHSDGTISAVWTTSSNAATGFPLRGAGYNYNNGTNWNTSTNMAIENPATRTGWPSIGLLGNGAEYILAHDATSGGFAFSTNGSKGSSSWTTTGPVLDDTTVVGEERAPIWNRSTSSGNYIHVVAAYTSSGDNEDSTIIDGVINPNTYSRSSDNGQTWDKYLTMLPGYDSSRAVSGGGDNYAITSRDSVVAIVMGGYGEAMTLWKSMDNGDNFTMIDIDGFQYPGTSREQWWGDTLDGNGGSIDVIIDHNEDVHVFWSYMRYLRTLFDGDTAVTYFPGTSGISYWKEGNSSPVLIAGAMDRDGSGTLDITAQTIRGLDDGQFPDAGWLGVAAYNTNGISAFPSAAIADNGDIFLVYSAPSEHAVHWQNTNYRDVLVVFSEDNGSTWSGIQNLTQSDFTEDVFASVAERADGNLHMVWQRDDIPGTNLQSNNTAQGNHPAVNNQIMYAAIPTSAITDGDIGPHTTGQDDLNKAAEIFFVSQSYPNPNEGSAEATIFLLNGSELNLEITNMYGQVMNSGSIGYYNGGNHVISMELDNLAPGMYFYTISTGEHSMTRKMQVQ